MRKTEYRRICEEIGSDDEVAELLGMDDRTIKRRKAGVYPIGKEAAWAIRGLAMAKQNGAIKPSKAAQ